MHSTKVAGKRQLDSSVEETNTKELKRQKSQEETSDIGFWATGPGGLALGNAIIIEKIVGFLKEGDICRWYDSSKTFKNKIDQMDDIFWRREAQKLATVLRKKDGHCLEDQWPEKTMREIFLILKSDVERRVATIRVIFDPHPFPLTVKNIADAASLAHHGFLGSVRGLRLKEVNLSSIPIKNLASLVACAQDKVRIDNVNVSSLIPILDNVQCEYLSITNQAMRTRATQALVRAMMTRVRKVSICLHRAGVFGYQEADLVEELTKYDGKGKCEKVDFLEMNYLEIQNRYDIEQWVRDCEWQVLGSWQDNKDYLLVKR